jgi:hypothetical protein
MSVSLTFYHLCRRYPGGIRAVAALLQMSEDTLGHKLSPRCTTHHLSVDEAEAITELTRDPAGAVDLARIAGMACVPLPQPGPDSSLMKGMSEIGREFSELLNAFNEAVQDNRISPNECDRFQRESLELFVACMSELAHMRRMAAERSPVIPIDRGKAASQ